MNVRQVEKGIAQTESVPCNCSLQGFKMTLQRVRTQDLLDDLSFSKPFRSF